MTLAGNVEFLEDSHSYWLNGERLSGITGLVAKKLNMRFPEHLMESHQQEGIYVHKEIQRWIETGRCESVHQGVSWLVNRGGFKGSLYSEVLVSDMNRYASAVDIVEVDENNGLHLYDIKKGNFKREYCTWQLSVYKYFAELAGFIVTGLTTISLAEQEFYKIFPKSKEDIERLLYKSETMKFKTVCFICDKIFNAVLTDGELRSNVSKCYDCSKVEINSDYVHNIANTTGVFTA